MKTQTGLFPASPPRGPDRVRFQRLSPWLGSSVTRLHRGEERSRICFELLYLRRL